MNFTATRLKQQKINYQDLSTPKEVVAYMGAMQAQDLEMSKWAIGQRLFNSTKETIENALNDGTLVRTHILRPTWHIVAGKDIRWMMALTGKNIKTLSATYERKLGMDAALFVKANDLIVKALEGGKSLTRQEVMQELEKGGIQTDSSRAVHFMINAETDAIVCNGTPKGKEITYALLDEKVPKGLIMNKEESLFSLAKIYFKSHAPATLHDFHWWSGLSMTDARAGLQSVKADLEEIIIDEKAYFQPRDLAVIDAQDSVFLLPAFDEYCVSYKDRSAVFDKHLQGQAITSNGIFKPIIVINGKVEGVWKRTIQKNKVLIEISFFDSSKKIDIEKLQSATKRFGEFLGLEVELRN